MTICLSVQIQRIPVGARPNEWFCIGWKVGGRGIRRALGLYWLVIVTVRTTGLRVNQGVGMAASFAQNQCKWRLTGS